MESKIGSRPTPQLVIGIIIIFLGVLFTLDNLNILAAGDFLRFWPLALMAFGLAKLLDADCAAGRLAGGIFFGLGSLLLLDRLHVLNFSFHFFWPLILVIIGLGIAWQAVMREKGPSDRAATVSAIAIFSGVERTCTSQDFRGGEITAIMGGCEIDLRQASMQVEEAVLNVFALFGGIEVRIPEDWLVVSGGFPVFGGFEEHTRAPKEGIKKRLLIKGVAIMGGVEIKN